MPAPLPYWLITMKVIKLEKSFLVPSKVSRLFVKTLTPDDKYSLLSRDNSMQEIQMHLSQKQEFFSQFFCSFFKSTWNFEYFQKKRTLIPYVFLKLSPRKDVLRKCPKTPVWEDPSTCGMVNGPKHWFSLSASAFTILIDHYEGNWIGKTLLSLMKIVKTFF